MNCGYCGIPIPQEINENELIPKNSEPIISQEVIFDDCDHEVQDKIDMLQDNFLQLKTLKEYIQKQLVNVEILEKFYK